MPELLTIDNLRAGYGEAVVLPGMTLSLPESQVLALLGRNGTGKTTLINSIVGITRRFGGSVSLGGADITALRPDQRARAGIGWVQHEETGRGLFVEHEGNSERQVRDDIERSLSALMEARPQVQFGPIQSVVQGARCESTPVCAMVVAVYEAAGWTIDMRGT